MAARTVSTSIMSISVAKVGCIGSWRHRHGAGRCICRPHDEGSIYGAVAGTRQPWSGSLTVPLAAVRIRCEPK